MARAELQVEVLYSPQAATVERRVVTLPAGATVQDALDASGLLTQWPALALSSCGVWSRRVERDVPLNEGDRVEVYRPLTIDPKEARRLRARRKP